MNISLPGEILFHIFGLSITNAVMTGWLVTFLVLLFGFVVRRSLKKVPGRFQAVVEAAYGYFYSNAVAIIGREDVARAVIPLVMSVFIYVLFSNWFGLLPGVGQVGFKEIADGKDIIIPFLRSPTSDLNTTIALALVSVGYIQYLGIRYTGFRTYMSKFFNFSSPLNFLIGIMELISEFSRIISFSLRLFANVFGGEVLLIVIFYLVYTMAPAVAVIPAFFIAIEVFVGFVQAYIFAFLIVIFTSLAVASHGGHDLEHVDVTSEVSINHQ